MRSIAEKVVAGGSFHPEVFDIHSFIVDVRCLSRHLASVKQAVSVEVVGLLIESHSDRRILSGFVLIVARIRDAAYSACSKALSYLGSADSLLLSIFVVLHWRITRYGRHSA